MSSASPREEGLLIDVCKPADGTVRVEVHGDVDLVSSPRLVEVLSDTMETDARTVIVDLGDVSFFDLHGLSALLHAEEIARARQRRFLLARLSPTVRTVVDITGLDGRLKVFDDEGGAQRFSGA